MRELEDYQKAGHDLYHTLQLSTYPVAIKYIKDEKEIPDRVMRPKSFRVKMSLCQAFTMVRRSGSSVAMTEEECFCTPAIAGHRWADVPIEELLKSQVIQGWHRDEEVEKIVLMSRAKYWGGKSIGELEEYCGFICSPLPKSIVIPDSILVYCDGAQLTHIIHALCYEYKYVPESSFDGFIESCIKGGLAPFLTQKPQVVIPGAGDRTFAGITEHELGIGLPAELIFYVLENLFKTGGMMNMGYPFNSALPMNLNEDITPGFRYLRDRIEERKKSS